VQAPELTAQSLAATLAPTAAGKRFLLIRASRGPQTLQQLLSASGGQVHSLVAYQHRDVAAADESLVQRMAEGEITWVTVTSDAIARSVVRLFGEHLRRAQLASLSVGVTQTLEELGHRVTVQAAEPTMQALVEAMVVSC